MRNAIRMRHFSPGLWVGVAALLLALSVLIAAPARAESRLTVNIWPSPRHNLIAEVMKPWMASVTAATDGRVRFVTPAAAMASGKGIYDAVAGGVVDVAYAIHGYTPARFPMSRIVEFPLGGNSATALSVAYWRTYKALLEAHAYYPGVVILGLFTHGPGSLFTRDKPIRRVEDLRHVKLRIGGGLQRRVAKALGVVIVAAEAPRNYEILSRGIADGTFLPIASVFRYNLQRFIRYHTAVPGGLYNTSFMMIINRDKWDALPAADWAAIRSVSGEAISRLAGASWDAQERQGRARMARSSITSITAGPEFIAGLRARIKPLEDAWVAEVKRKRGLDGRAALAFLRAEAARLDAEIRARSGAAGEGAGE